MKTQDLLFLNVSTSDGIKHEIQQAFQMDIGKYEGYIGTISFFQFCLTSMYAQSLEGLTY